MRNTHTHKGHCQACGRTQAVSTDGSLIAKHGYDVSFGFFNGTCNGSDNKPLEIEKTLAENTIKYLQDFVEASEKALTNFETVSSVNVMYVTKNGIKKLESIPAFQVERSKKRNYSVETIPVSEISDVINNCHYYYGSNHTDYKYSRSTPEEIIKEANTLWVRNKKESIDGAIYHMSFLQGLIARVHGNPLINVADQAKILTALEVEAKENFFETKVITFHDYRENRDRKRKVYSHFEKIAETETSIGKVGIKISRPHNRIYKKEFAYREKFTFNCLLDGKRIARNKLLEKLGGSA